MSGWPICCEGGVEGGISDVSWVAGRDGGITDQAEE